MAASLAPAASQTHVGVWIELLSPSPAGRRRWLGLRAGLSPLSPDSKMGGVTGASPGEGDCEYRAESVCAASGCDEVPGACASGRLRPRVRVCMRRSTRPRSCLTVVVGVPGAGKSVMHQSWPHDRPESGVGLALVRRPGCRSCDLLQASASIPGAGRPAQPPRVGLGVLGPGSTPPSRAWVNMSAASAASAPRSRPTGPVASKPRVHQSWPPVRISVSSTSDGGSPPGRARAPRSARWPTGTG